MPRMGLFNHYQFPLDDGRISQLTSSWNYHRQEDITQSRHLHDRQINKYTLPPVLRTSTLNKLHKSLSGTFFDSMGYPGTLFPTVGLNSLPSSGRPFVID